MIMKGYSTDFEKENFACARMEDTNISFKDLAEVCGRIRNKNADWAVEFLEKAADGKIPVLYKRHNKRLGHRKELGGQRGRYPKKAAKAILKTLKSALANGITRGMGESYQIMHASANKKMGYGRVAPKGRWARSDYETARIEVVLKPLEEVPKGVEVRPPAKKEEKKEEPKKLEEKKPEPKKEKAHVHEAHHGNPAHEAKEHGKHEKHEADKEHVHEHKEKKEEPKPEIKADVKKEVTK